MATVINRTTRQVLRSVNEPDYPLSDWIWSPVLPGGDPKYWIIKGDTVRVMTPAEKNEPAALKRWRSEQRQLLSDARDDYLDTWYSLNDFLALRVEQVRALAEGKTNRAAYFRPWILFHDAILGEYKTRRKAIRNAANHNAIFAVSLDFSPLDAQAPATKINIADGLGVNN